MIFIETGSIGTLPEQYTKPLAMIAWEYIPGRGFGALLVSTGVLGSDISTLMGVL